MYIYLGLTFSLAVLLPFRFRAIGFCLAHLATFLILGLFIDILGEYEGGFQAMMIATFLTLYNLLLLPITGTAWVLGYCDLRDMRALSDLPTPRREMVESPSPSPLPKQKFEPDLNP